MELQTVQLVKLTDKNVPPVESDLILLLENVKNVKITVKLARVKPYVLTVKLPFNLMQPTKIV